MNRVEETIVKSSSNEAGLILFNRLLDTCGNSLEYYEEFQNIFDDDDENESDSIGLKNLRRLLKSGIKYNKLHSFVIDFYDTHIEGILSLNRNDSWLRDNSIVLRIGKVKRNIYIDISSIYNKSLLTSEHLKNTYNDEEIQNIISDEIEYPNKIITNILQLLVFSLKITYDSESIEDDINFINDMLKKYDRNYDSNSPLNLSTLLPSIISTLSEITGDGDLTSITNRVIDMASVSAPEYTPIISTLSNNENIRTSMDNIMSKIKAFSDSPTNIQDILPELSSNFIDICREGLNECNVHDIDIPDGISIMLNNVGDNIEDIDDALLILTDKIITPNSI